MNESYRGDIMELNFQNMTLAELETTEIDLMESLNGKLRNMKYDSELEEIYELIEQLIEEKERRKSNA
jgi:hypothetical protein